ncbi:MAG TPA: hypothetical protein VHB79_07370 [Polyangiaceae bacterium]|nr:hypothetical protein [Polyangiaceae bacterium]
MGRFDRSGRGSCVYVVALLALGCQDPVQLQSGAAFVPSSPVPVVSVRGGEALVAWHRSGDKVYVTSALEGSSSWSTPSAIADGQKPEVALSTSGAAFVVYENAGKTAAVVRKSGAWGPPATLRDDVSSFLAVAADGSGNALALFSKQGVRARVYKAGSGWQSTHKLDDAEGVVKVAMNEAGRGVAAWCGNGDHLYAAAYEPASGWGTPEHTASADCCKNYADVISPGVSVAIAESGDAYAIGAGTTGVCLLRRAAGSASWVHGLLSSTSGVSGPQVSASTDGHALVAWLQDTSGGRKLKARHYDPATGWTATMTGPSGLGAGPIGAGYGSSGCAALVFRGGNLALQYVGYCTTDTTLRPAVDITPGGSLANAPYFIRSSGNPLEPAQGVTVWQQGGHEDIWSARTGI